VADKQLNHTPDPVRYLEETGLTKGMTPDEVRALADLAEHLNYSRGAAIIQEDTKTRDLYVVCNGRVSIRLTLPSTEDKEEVIYSMREGQIFGEIALVDGSPRSATVRAEDDVEVLKFEFQKLSALLDERPRIGYLMMRNIASIIATRVRNTNMLWRNSLIW